MVGIISNTAALFAQRNLEVASASSGSSIARLSSGEAIVKASDDVAGLAIGTSLQTNITTLKTVLTQTAQASSLLSIADAALENVAEILQRQKSLATQANSGSISDTERAFLNEEFSNLTSEIDRIVSNTNFNGTNLIDGNISSNTTLQSLVPTDNTDHTVVGTLGSTAITAAATLTVTTASDPTLIGGLSGATVSVNAAAANDVDIHININGKVYTAEGVDFDAAAATNVDFTNDETGAVIRISSIQQDGGLTEDVDDATSGETFATALEADLANITIYQDRAFSSSTTSGVGLADTAFENTILDGLTNTEFELRSQHFNTSSNVVPSITNFVVTAETASQDGSISVTIGGEVFTTASGTFDGNGTDISALAGITLVNQSDSNETFFIDSDQITGTVAIDTATNAQALEDALNNLFGVGSTGGLNFQVGTSASDLIGVSLGSAATSSIYVDDAGAVQTISVTSTSNATTASEVIDNAINTVTTRRATVGALQSRFEFAAANVSASIQNQESARSSFLDVDVAAESTDFATAQVRLQASISVLAQANQIPQNLLKLIG